MDRDDARAVEFRTAVEAGDAEAIRRVFEKHPAVRDIIDAPMFAFASPALVHLVGMGARQSIDALLDEGADPDAKSEWDAGPYSALHRVVDSQAPIDTALADHLIRHGATVDVHAAAGLGHIDRLTALLDENPSRVSEPGPDGATPLHLAMNVDVASCLLDRGAEIDKRCVDHKSTAAQWASAGRPDVMRFLIEKGAKVDLFMAAVLNDVALAERILASDPEAIHVRVRPGHPDEHVGFGDKYVWALDFAETPVEVARRLKHTEVCTHLLGLSEPRVRLLYAAREGDLAAVEHLVEESPGIIAAIPSERVSELLLAGPGPAAILLRCGLDPNARDDDTQATTAHHAAWRNQRALLEVLIEHGADLGIRDGRYAATPIGWANECGNDEMVEWLSGVSDLDIVDAAWMGDTERVREILRSDPSAAHGPDPEHISPLRAAAWYGYTEIVALLLEHGADPTLSNPESGQTALDVALARGHDTTAALLAGEEDP